MKETKLCNRQSKTDTDDPSDPAPQRFLCTTSWTPGSPSATWTAARRGPGSVLTATSGWMGTYRGTPRGQALLHQAATPPASPAPAPPVSPHSHKQHIPPPSVSIAERPVTDSSPDEMVYLSAGVLLFLLAKYHISHRFYWHSQTVIIECTTIYNSTFRINLN